MLKPQTKSILLNNLFNDVVNFCVDTLEESARNLTQPCSNSLSQNSLAVSGTTTYHNTVGNYTTAGDFTLTTNSGGVSSNTFTIDYYPLIDIFPVPTRWYWPLVMDYKSPEIPVQSYPVSSYGVDEDMNNIISIAISGFSEDELSIKREDLKLIVTGTSKKSEEKKIKYLYNKIGRRDFSISFDGSEKWDYDKLDAKIEDHLLVITIPTKDEFKPVKKEYQIKK